MIKDSQNVLSRKSKSCLSIILNRPEVINSLSEAMIDNINGLLDQAQYGSTGWMFTRCPRGYAEYLGLTGYQMIGSECVRLGFATHYTKSEYIPRLIDKLENNALKDQLDKQEMINRLMKEISGFLDFNIPVNHAMDAWVKKYFAGKTYVNEILAPLSSCLDQRDHCNDVFTSIAERSTTALVLTLKLLRHNEGKPIADVFSTELKAAQFITRHPDYIEGVRARLVDRNSKPKWTPDSLSKVDLKNFIP